MFYKVKCVPTVATTVSREDIKKLEELRKVIPVLRKHGISGEARDVMKDLREVAKEQSYKLTMTRKFLGKELTASKTIGSLSKKVSALKELKANILKQISEIRKANRPNPESFNIHTGVTVPKMDMVYLEAGSFLKVFARKVRDDMMRGSRKPTTDDQYIGIEIELGSKKDREFIADKIHAAGLAKHIGIKSDGSIGAGAGALANYQHGHEIVVLAKQSEYADIISRLCAVLAECEVKVDKSCGLHVHLDMRSRDMAKVYKNLAKTQHFLYAMIPAARKASRYSRPVRTANYEEASQDRYHGINVEAFHKYKTIELRMHCGTVEAAKINNWIAILIAIAESNITARAPTSMKKLQELTGMSDSLMEYMQGRINKFAAQHTATIAEQSSALITLPGADDTVATDMQVLEDSEAA